MHKNYLQKILDKDVQLRQEYTRVARRQYKPGDLWEDDRMDNDVTFYFRMKIVDSNVVHLNVIDGTLLVMDRNLKAQLGYPVSSSRILSEANFNESALLQLSFY